MIGEARLDHGESDCLDGGAGHTYIYGRARHSVDGRRASFLGAGMKNNGYLMFEGWQVILRPSAMAKIAKEFESIRVGVVTR